MASFELEREQRDERSEPRNSDSGVHNTKSESDYGVEQSPKTARKSKKHGKLRRVLSKYKLRLRPRLVGKHGGLKVVATDVAQKHGMYLSDLFTTMIDSKWRWISLLFITAYTGSWMGFGCVWYLITYLRGGNYCVHNVESFVTAFLFSLETQTTIGYGGRQISGECPEAIILLNIQSLSGFLINALIMGLIFAKLSRPRNRAETILFSKKALVCVRDGKMCLTFRVGDIRKSQILHCHIRVQLFRTRKTKEGQVLPFYQQDLKTGIDWNDQNYGNNTIFLILPLTIIHVIDEESPFFTMTPKDLRSCDFELVAILEGTVEATGMLTQAKTSYIGEEILWGYEFKNTLDHTSWKAGRFRVNYSHFDRVVPVDTPRVSALSFYEGKVCPSSGDSDDSGSGTDVFYEQESPDEVSSKEIQEISIRQDMNKSENGSPIVPRDQRDDPRDDVQLRDRKTSNSKMKQNGQLRMYEFENRNVAYDPGDDSDILFV
ncbi:G protein-activated inward rectifier potassium channel 3 isoform X2 [Nematostella vectensis]|nr:G protein-activated inward rectifier potassium channel 3 isoform X2 [Nematostella vectensis]XP_032234396.2 G protein-activated inward rectifier potassium channel 3 isoform X2 [Nematostella vectensis]XP_032234397.2 G protein-activated inward rectifier potassium channel 3 isoform X2 [Nematostella vectensis]XP_048576131.1 G protein-activated inward rectifier potassium channel 3 isoform X2 [Nematostella vectensis]